MRLLRERLGGDLAGTSGRRAEDGAPRGAEGGRAVARGPARVEPGFDETVARGNTSVVLGRGGKVETLLAHGALAHVAETVESGTGTSRLERLARDSNTVAPGLCAARDVQKRRGVDQHVVPDRLERGGVLVSRRGEMRRRSRVVEDRVEGESVLVGRSSLHAGEGVQRKAEVALGVNLARRDLAVLEAPNLMSAKQSSTSSGLSDGTLPPLQPRTIRLGCWKPSKGTHPGRSRDRDLIQSLTTTNDERAVDAEQTQHLREGVSELTLCDTEHHTLRARRVDERTEDVEDRSEVELATDRRNVGERRVVVRGEQEEEGRGGEELWHLLDGEGETTVERDQQVRRSGRRSSGSRAVLLLA